MLDYFAKTTDYLNSLDLTSVDPLDKKAHELVNDEEAYERASQALRRRYSRGANEVQGVDRGGRLTKILSERSGGNENTPVKKTQGETCPRKN